MWNRPEVVEIISNRNNFRQNSNPLILYKVSGIIASGSLLGLEISIKNRNKLGRCRILLQWVSGDPLQSIPIQFPCAPDDCADIPLHSAGCGFIVLCNLRVEPLCCKQQLLWILGGEQDGKGDVKETCVICGDPELIQQAIYGNHRKICIVSIVIQTLI